MPSGAPRAVVPIRSALLATAVSRGACEVGSSLAVTAVDPSRVAEEKKTLWIPIAVATFRAIS